jgi:photosystem II stability/assembly factor-like uncharacterized protein
MRRLLLFVGLLSVTYGSIQAQWTVEDSGSTADLRGVDNVGNGIAWASGTNGSVLRTEDGGYLWQACAIPPGAEHLDFRGIQAFDANTAIVMSSGKGDLSRLYKTTDGCQTWKLVFTNPDKDGFWDAVRIATNVKHGAVIGDPVNGDFALWESWDNGETWSKSRWRFEALPNEAIYAASNSALAVEPNAYAGAFVTGGPLGSRIYTFQQGPSGIGGTRLYPLPLARGTPSSGGFSIFHRSPRFSVIVGGDYMKPDDRAGTAVYGCCGNWQPSQTLPHGYRSAVAYDATSKTWITVGPNGTDISTNDGKNWRALHPGPNDTPDADSNWNALSLPFVVGPHGRIGKLNPHALAP